MRYTTVKKPISFLEDAVGASNHTNAMMRGSNKNAILESSMEYIMII